ncbi:MAG: STAS domain-containing protein [Acidiferrobacter sp.]
MATLTPTGPGQYRLQGAVTFRDEPPESLWRTPLIPSAEQVTVDVSGLDQGDSVVLALLLEWERLARLGGYQFGITGASMRLEDLIRVSGLAKLFGAPA